MQDMNPIYGFFRLYGDPYMVATGPAFDKGYC